MKKNILSIAASLLVASSLSAHTALATTVSPAGNGSVGILTDLGYFTAGSYHITGSGIVDLVGDGSFQISPDGLPATTVTTPNYSYFNPNGSYIADNAYGAAGTNARIGALIGTFSSAPANYTDWFLIGYSTTVTLNTSGHIYASVNDTYHNNDTGSFEANVSAVPLPTAVWLLGSGLVSLIGIARRKAV